MKDNNLSKEELDLILKKVSDTVENKPWNNSGEILKPQVEAEFVQDVDSVKFPTLEPRTSPTSEINDLRLLLDVDLAVRVALGRTKKSVNEILNLTTGTIIALDKLAGEPLDVVVNNKLIAKGEVVVLDERFGVRISDITNKKERLRRISI